MNYILRRKGYGEGLVDVNLFSVTGLELHMAETQPKDSDYVFRWGCTANTFAKKTVNTAAAIHKVYDKIGFRREMDALELCPKTWFSIGEFMDRGAMMFPVLVRKNKHSRSEDMYVCNTGRELIDICETLGKDNYYISELVKKEHEYRVMFCSGRVIGVIEKIPRNKEDVSWGCVEVGEYKYINWEEWPLDMVEVAMKAADLSGLDFGAIDVISDDKRHYVLEINSACWLSPYFCKIFIQAFDYIVKNGKKIIPRVLDKGYKGYIHPSRYAGAI